MACTSSRTLTVDSFTVGWIAPLPYERAAGIAMLDERLEPPEDFEKNDRDSNQYTWGRIGKHHVVIASLPSGDAGTSAAATAAASLLSSLPSVRIGLLVGVGAGVPDQDHGYDIRLGDVVVSQPQGTTGGVVHYDLAKAVDGAYERTRTLNMPPAALRAGLAKLQAEHEMEPSAIPTYLAAMRTKHPQMAKSSRSKPGYVHQGPEHDGYFASGNLVEREARESLEPEIHYGTIASGNTLIQDSHHRDQILAGLRGREHIVCFDPESAGLMNHFPCLVVRGISGYADEADNTMWERYAAATAAAFGKELLAYLDSQEVFKSQKIGQLQSQVDHVQEDMSRLIEHAEQRDQDYKTFEITAWLSPADPSANFNKAMSQRQEGTGKWFLDNAKYTNWKNDRNGSIWLHGKAGSGKTVLSSTIVEDLRSIETGSVIFFFFDFNDSQKQSFQSMIRALTAQLYQQHRASRSHLDRLFTNCNKQSQPQDQALVQTLQDMLATARDTVIVLDALDECTGRRELLKWLTCCFANSVPVLMTSRSEHDIQTTLGSKPLVCAEMSLQPRTVDSDILAFVTSQLVNNEGFRRWKSSPDVLEMIETKLMEKANGMFRWAACQLDVLEACLDLPSLEEALTSLPQDLNETYDRILARIPPPRRPTATRLLKFLAYSHTPLELTEAVDIIAVQLDSTPSFSERNRMPDPEEISLVCPNLIEVTSNAPDEWQSSRRRSSSGKSGTFLHLAHLSVKEYLRSDSVQTDFRADLEETHARSCIVQVSLAYLSVAHEFHHTLHKSMASHRMYHARFAEHRGFIRELICQFFANETAFRYWEHGGLLFGYLCGLDSEQYDSDVIMRRRFTANLGPHSESDALHYACSSGLLVTATYLVENGADLEAPGRMFTASMQAACLGGHEGVVRMLLERGAQIEYQDDHFRLHDHMLSERAKERRPSFYRQFNDQPTRARLEHRQPLYIACSKGHSAIVSLLLLRDADPSRCPLALRAAVDAGHEAVARLLLRHGVDVKAYDDGGDALTAASRRGREDIVQLLLDSGAQPRPRSRENGNAVTSAAACGHLSVVKMLLQNGADANTSPDLDLKHRNCRDSAWKRFSNPNWTPLQAAVSRGYEAIARLLLDNGADVNARANVSDTALREAVRWGIGKDESDGIVRLLLERGANVNVPDTEAEGSALYTACATNAPIPVIQLLLEHGADVNSPGSNYGSALLASCAQGAVSSRIVQLLLRHGADVYNPGSRYGSALVAACGSVQCVDLMREQKVRLLLEKGADINVGGYAYERTDRYIYETRFCPSTQSESVEVQPDGARSDKARSDETQHGIQFDEDSMDDTNSEDEVGIKEDHVFEDDRCFENDPGQEARAESSHHSGSSWSVSEMTDRHAYGSALEAACALGRTRTVELLLNHGGIRSDVLEEATAAAGNHPQIAPLLQSYRDGQGGGIEDQEA